MLPFVTSENRAIRRAIVVFPPPDGPTNATCSPARISRLIFFSASFEAPSYRNETPSKQMEVSFDVFLAVLCVSGFLLRIPSSSLRCALTRACLKKAFRELRVPVCGRFYPNEGGVAGYGNRMRVKYTAKWGLQIAEMIFQTRSSSLPLSIPIFLHPILP